MGDPAFLFNLIGFIFAIFGYSQPWISFLGIVSYSGFQLMELGGWNLVAGSLFMLVIGFLAMALSVYNPDYKEDGRIFSVIFSAIGLLLLLVILGRIINSELAPFASSGAYTAAAGAFLQTIGGVIGILSKEQKDIKRRNTEGLMI